jgi:hypothetical protein
VSGLKGDKMKLFTMGDSLSQGFMSGAAARTDRCYSTLIARAMGLKPGSSYNDETGYYYPEWKMGGLPANLETIIRRLNKFYGPNIRGLEWVTILHHINRVIDRSEDYYEREEGKAGNKYHGNVPYFHNVSSWAYDIADSWLVTPQLCMEEIARRRPIDGRDGWLAAANAAFYRTALKVLSPNLDRNYTQLDWLRHHARTRGIENLLLWLGNNNAMKTILTFEIEQTTNNPDYRPHQMTHWERRKQRWNLWHPGDFEAEYNELIERVNDIMENDNICKKWNVFIGTIPYATIVPLLKGIGQKTPIGLRGTYYRYYTYVPFTESFAKRKKLYLPFHRAIYIDDCIGQYNNIIRQICSSKNIQHRRKAGVKDQGDRYYIVELCAAFKQMDWQRNNGTPPYEFPGYFRSLEIPVNTEYYHVDAEGRFIQGGLFSLDGVHPSAIGQGLIAREFMKVMKAAGVSFKSSLDWPEIFAGDTLYQEPITLMQEIYRHEALAEHLIKLIQRYI